MDYRVPARDTVYHDGIEFKFFILRYLIYAQKNEKQTYTNIMGNTLFLKSFVAVEQSFQKVVNEYIAFYKKAFSEIQKKGVSVPNEPNSEFVFVNGSGTVLLEKNKDYKKLNSELTKKNTKR